VVEWIPQNAVLRHSHTKMFLTCGGINSVLEAALALVPVVIIPK